MKRHFSTYFVRRPVEIGACGKHEDIWIANVPETRKILGEGKFPDLHTFTKLIAKALSSDYLNEVVAEAYWLGNDKTVLVDELCTTYLENGKLPEVVDEIKRKYSGKKMPLTHLAQVMLVSGNDTRAINGCMVAEAEVLRVLPEGNIKVRRDGLTNEGSKQVLTRIEQNVNNPTKISLNVGDRVALHMGQVAVKLNREQAATLQKSNRKVVKVFNTFLGKSD